MLPKTKAFVFISTRMQREESQCISHDKSLEVLMLYTHNFKNILSDTSKYTAYMFNAY